MSIKDPIGEVHKQLKTIPNNQTFAFKFLNLNPFSEQSITSIYTVNKSQDIYAVKDGDEIKNTQI